MTGSAAPDVRGAQLGQRFRQDDVDGLPLTR